MLTRYPNSECEAHQDVVTSDPVCIVCMKGEIESLRTQLQQSETLADAVSDHFGLVRCREGEKVRGVLQMMGSYICKHEAKAISLSEQLQQSEARVKELEATIRLYRNAPTLAEKLDEAIATHVENEDG